MRTCLGAAVCWNCRCKCRPACSCCAPKAWKIKWASSRFWVSSWEWLTTSWFGAAWRATPELGRPCEAVRPRSAETRWFDGPSPQKPCRYTTAWAAIQLWALQLPLVWILDLLMWIATGSRVPRGIAWVWTMLIGYNCRPGQSSQSRLDKLKLRAKVTEPVFLTIRGTRI